MATDDAVVTLTAHLLQCSSNTRTVRQEMILQKLAELDELMMTVGPMNRASRLKIGNEAKAIANFIRLQGNYDALDRWMFTAAREFLFDIGLEMPLTSAKVRQLFGHIEAIVRFYVGQKRNVVNLVNLSRAVMKWGEMFRIVKSEREAAARFNWAYHILQEGPYRLSPKDNLIAFYCHHASSWLLRTRAEALSCDRQSRELERMGELAEQVADPRLWILHYRDAAYFARVLQCDFDLSREHIAAMERWRRALPDGHQCADITLPRPKVDILFGTNRDEGVDFVRQQYVKLYEAHRNEYHFDVLQEWSRVYQFDFETPLSKPEFLSPALPLVCRRFQAPFV